jgi:hypothetical protein
VEGMKIALVNGRKRVYLELITIVLLMSKC